MGKSTQKGRKRPPAKKKKHTERGRPKGKEREGGGERKNEELTGQCETSERQNNSKKERRVDTTREQPEKVRKREKGKQKCCKKIMELCLPPHYQRSTSTRTGGSGKRKKVDKYGVEIVVPLGGSTWTTKAIWFVSKREKKTIKRLDQNVRKRLKEEGSSVETRAVQSAGDERRRCSDER